MAPAGEKVAEAEVREIFDEFDMDGDGAVTTGELEEIFYVWIPILEAIEAECGDDEACWDASFEFLEATGDKCGEDEACWEAELTAAGV